MLRAMCGAVALGAGGLAVLTASGCSDGGSGVVVARIGGEPLSAAALNHWVAVDAAVGGEPASREAPPKSRVLDFLISSRWLIGEARELGVHVSESEATKQLELLRFDQIEGRQYRALSHDSELKRLLLSQAVGARDRLWLMKASMLAAKVEASYLSQAAREVPRRRVARYYAQHRRLYFLPQWRDLEILTSLNKAEVTQARREIDSGKPFLGVEQRFPYDPEAPNGLQHLVEGHEEREFEEVIFAAKPHVLTGPAKLQLYYLFEVFDGEPAHQQTLAKVEGQIRRQLAPQQALARLLPSFEARWIAQTSCNPGYVVQRCSQYRGPKTTRDSLMFRY